jgi:tetratricopeptide (TPR) repeat protein
VFVAGLLAATLVAMHQAALARAEAQKAAKVSQFLSDMLASAGDYSFNPKQLTVAQMLDAAAPLVEKGWKDDPLIEATLRTSLGSSYSAVQSLDRAKTQLDAARALFHKVGNPAGEAEALYFLAINENNGSLYVEAVRHYREAIRLLESLGKSAPPLLVFRSKVGLADVEAVNNQDLAEARRLVAECFQLAAREPSIPRAGHAWALGTRGAILLDEGNNDEAEKVLRQAMTEFTQSDSKNDRILRTVYYLTILNSRRGNFTDAGAFAHQYYAMMLESLGPDHVRTLDGKLLWERYRADLGQAKEAVAETLDAMRMVRQFHPALSLDLWSPLVATVHVVNLAGQFVEAESLAREALAVAEKYDPREADGRKSQPLAELGIALRGQHRYREAAGAFQRSAAIYQSLGPAWARRTAEIRKMLADMPTR